MKRVVISIVLLGMTGWAIYQFAFSQKNNDTVQIKTEQIQEEDLLVLEENNQATSVLKYEVGLGEGQLAPDFQLTTLSGEDVRLSDFRGKPVMLNFWATWCPPCIAEMPDMERLYQNSNVEVLAVNLTETERTIDDVFDFVDEFELTFPILIDEFIEVAMIYEIQPIPTSFFIDSQGVIQFRAFGALTFEQMEEVLTGMN